MQKSAMLAPHYATDVSAQTTADTLYSFACSTINMLLEAQRINADEHLDAIQVLHQTVRLYKNNVDELVCALSQFLGVTQSLCLYTPHCRTFHRYDHDRRDPPDGQAMLVEVS